MAVTLEKLKQAELLIAANAGSMSAADKAAAKQFLDQKRAELIAESGVPVGDLATDPILQQAQLLQAQQGNFKGVQTPDQAKEQQKLSGVGISTDILEKNLQEAEVKGPVFGRLSQGIVGDFGNVNAMTGGALFPEAMDYEALRKSMIGPLARAISGEVGVLTDRDIARAEGLLPKLSDAQKVRENKLKNLREIIAKKSANTGSSVKPQSVGRFTIEAVE